MKVSHLSVIGGENSYYKAVTNYKKDYFSSQLLTKKITRKVIYKHSKTVAHAFHIAKEKEKNLSL